ncbi:MAG: glutathione peroxidase [Flavobacteriaceae bacterium]|jgi:glutathione peroxidase|nr:glutathione peroxidase [Flavobacteriaceae bacterium]MBL6684156.1 glutathione peroxidase [Flavobacteriaceae bacterium]PDH53830.1 MAG: glutathione peroxidase [Cryomorphaceae bacterium MED-G14]|tara:strand:- start:1356 stop:1907 length:552 start_codon:yes stop_codon:yes gene_type:complete
MNKLFLLSFFMGINCILSQSLSMQESIYDFTVKDIYGDDFKLSELKGKKIMIVNTASKCGLTSQYKGLENLYSRYKNMNFVIIGFPANNFLWQEPGSNEKIANFCKENYGVSFPMMSKISVKGSSMHPLYKFLTDKSKNGVISSSVSWNFQKYLINEDGSIHKVISPRTKPEDQKIIDWITSS